MALKGPVTLVSCHQDIFELAACRILERAESLPNLTNTIVLLPDLQFAARLRRQLLLQAGKNDCAALLGPVITTAEQWLCEQYPIEQSIPGRAQRELMLVEVLMQHPGFFRGSNPWQLGANLVSLFDELTVNRVSIPDDLPAFTEHLKTAYGIEDQLPEPLGMEASIVHRLWQAWHTQLGSNHMLDPGLASLQRMSLNRQQADAHFYFFVGFDSISTAEYEWIDSLLASDRAECLLYQHGYSINNSTLSPIQAPIQILVQQAPPCSSKQAASQCLDAVFQTGSISLPERAATMRKTCPESPLRDYMAIFAANSAEQEARAIDLQVRQWLLQGKCLIGIVTEDRRLARRVRALLERAGIKLLDTGGWALSTTSAAAVLERWLETIEEDFAHQPLLDVLKSPFMFPDDDREQLESTVYRLEHDIILHEQIARGLQRYRSQIARRLQRLQTSWTADTAEQLNVLLNRLDQAADPLRDYADGKTASPLLLLQALRDSLTRAGIWSAFETDLAGQRIIHEWQLLGDAASHCTLEMNWIEFRAWLGAALERHVFRPATTDSPVLLLTLQQAQLGQFEALVMGACDREYLPSGTAKSPFFNDPVRQDLGLPVWPLRYAEQLQRFRRLLESAPDILLTWHQQANGETRLPATWLEMLQTFHQLAWGDKLESSSLGQLLQQSGTQVRGNNPSSTPVPATFPRPTVPAALLPERLSVSAHRNLISCPYKFYVASCLKLRPKEEIKEAFEKAEYGQLVHRALELFHKGDKAYPGPFGEAVTAANQSQAIKLLEQISEQVFSRELEDNFEHRAWLRRWRLLIPEYIKWQSAHQLDWQFLDAEQDGSLELPGGRLLYGRLDRIDHGPAGSDILDYKTGAIPKQEAVDSGEEVQLPSYALLTSEPPARVEYLQLDGRIRSGVSLEGAALSSLAEGVKQRLIDVLAALEGGANLPAWGDAGSCRYCEMDGLCRRQAWLESPQIEGAPESQNHQPPLPPGEQTTASDHQSPLPPGEQTTADDHPSPLTPGEQMTADDHQSTLPPGEQMTADDHQSPLPPGEG
jgi:ATP-dependent helicase/nuclease subunit B